MELLLSALLVLLTMGLVGWSALALHYTGPGPPALRKVLAACAILDPILFGVLLDSLVAALVLASIVFVAVLTWFLSRKPAQDADWQANCARLATAHLVGDELTVGNLRNFEYRSVSDYTPRWETRRFDLSKLEGLDMFFSHWSGPRIAHTIMSWSFSDGQHLAISIETRNRVGQGYSAIAGFFRQFPIYYVVADERDVVRLRTNYRKESVWLYRMRVPEGAPRALLLDYIEAVNRLAGKPAWYNALTDNCTTTIQSHALRLDAERNPWGWQLLLNGYLPELLYKQGKLDTSLPYPELHARSNINMRAEAADYEGFPAAIRVGLPNPRPG